MVILPIPNMRFCENLRFLEAETNYFGNYFGFKAIFLLIRVFELAELRHHLDNLILMSKFPDAYHLFMEHIESIKTLIHM